MKNRVVGAIMTVACLVALACGGGGAEPAEIPRPASLAGVDDQVGKLVEAALTHLEANPDSALAWAGLGMIYHANEMFDLARRAYAQALVMEPDNAHWQYHQAVVLEKLNEVEAALAAMGRSIELEPTYAASYWRRGTWRMNQGEREGAEADFRRAIELAPDDPAGPIGLARVLLAESREAEAADLLEGLIRSDPDDPLTHLLLGNAYRALGRADEATRHLRLGQGEQVVRQDAWTASEILRFKLSFGAQMQTAVTLLGMGQIEQATRILEDLRQREPGDARLLRHLGRAYLVSDRLAEGLVVLQGGVDAHPDDPQMLMEAASAQQLNGHPDEALALLDRAIAIKPEVALAHARRGAVLQSLQQYPRAAEAFRQALVYDPKDVHLMRALGDCFGHMRQYEVAAAAYQHALTFDETDADTHARLAFMLFRLGRYAGAETRLVRALELSPENPRWTQLLEQVRHLKQSGAAAEGQG